MKSFVKYYTSFLDRVQFFISRKKIKWKPTESEAKITLPKMTEGYRENEQGKTEISIQMNINRLS
jgi:hypothetical protein